MKISAIALAALLAPAATQAGGALHGNLFNYEDADRSVLSDIQVGGATPTAVQPGMGSGEGAAIRASGPRLPRKNPDLDRSILYDVGAGI